MDKTFYITNILLMVFVYCIETLLLHIREHKYNMKHVGRNKNLCCNKFCGNHLKIVNTNKNNVLNNYLLKIHLLKNYMIKMILLKIDILYYITYLSIMDLIFSYYGCHMVLHMYMIHIVMGTVYEHVDYYCYGCCVLGLP